jgi:hypothetical protein
MLKHLIKALIVAMAFNAWTGIISLGEPSIASAKAKAPEYAKWGRIAMEKTKDKYSAKIVDYSHVGRKQISNEVAEEVFKLWLRDGTREYGVRVSIQFYTSNERIIDIKFQETPN